MLAESMTERLNFALIEILFDSFDLKLGERQAYPWDMADKRNQIADKVAEEIY
jgi:hypothetical protein